MASIQDQTGAITSFSYARKSNDYRYSDTRYEDFDSEVMLTSDYKYIGQHEWMLLTQISFPNYAELAYTYEEDAVTSLEIDESYWRVFSCKLWDWGYIKNFSINYNVMDTSGWHYIEILGRGLGSERYFCSDSYLTTIHSYAGSEWYKTVNLSYYSISRPGYYREYSIYASPTVTETWSYDRYGRLTTHAKTDTSHSYSYTYSYTNTYPTPTEILY